MKFINKNIFILSVIPFIVLLLSFLMNNVMGPFWRYADPSYVYLFNALHFLKGEPASHIDHPGTPLQLLILLITCTLNIGSSTNLIVKNVLTNPESYLHAVHFVITFGIFLSSILLALYVYNKTKDVLAALLTQLPSLSFLITKSFETSLPVPPIVANVIPEPLLMIILNLFNLSWLILFFADTQKKEFYATLLLGFICGLGLATKLTFFPIILCVLLILSWQLKKLFILLCASSFFLWTLPIVHEYSAFWRWTQGILTHTGNYGEGTKGLVDLHSFVEIFLKDILPAYWFFIILTAGTLLWSSIEIIRNNKDRRYKFLSITSIAVLLQFAIVSKHYSAHYLLPGICLFSSIFLLLYLGPISQNKTLKKLTVFFVISFTLLTITQAFFYFYGLKSLTNEFSKIQEQVYSKYPHCAVITPADSNPFFSQNAALIFGDIFCSRSLLDKFYTRKESNELSLLYPNSFYVNFDATGVSARNPGYGICDFKGRVYADDILAANPYVIFINYNFDFYNYNKLTLSRFPFTSHLVDSSKHANIYQITSSTDKQSAQLLFYSLELLKRGNYPEAFAAALESEHLNYQPRGEVEYYLSIMYKYLHQK